MSLIKCPRCGTKLISSNKRFLFRRRWGPKKCSTCGALFRVKNGFSLSLLSGFLFGAVIGGSNYWRFANEWGIIGFVIFETFGRWEVADETNVRPAFTIWSRISYICSWIAAITAIAACLLWSLMLKKTLRPDPLEIDTYMEHLWRFITYQFVLWSIFSIASLLSLIAAFIKSREDKKLQIADSKEKS